MVSQRQHQELNNALDIHCQTLKNTINENEVVFYSLCEAVLTALRNGNKVIFFGNGGSASDAQHLAAEFICKYSKERLPYSALALTTDTSILTSVSNDFSFDDVFTRQLYALGKVGDVAIGITTSGKSKNVLNALNFAKQLGIITAVFTGNGGKDLNVDYCLAVKSKSTPRIQEAHIFLGHQLCAYVENEMG